MRPDWDQYFLELAAVVAKRSTCNRKQVGCVLVKDNRILTTGYGGSIRGQPHCTEVGCEIDEKTGGCVRTVHAEMNALAQAARNGVSTDGSTAYTTLSPCYWCFKTMVNAGVVRFVYSEQYRIPLDVNLIRACGVDSICIDVQTGKPPLQGDDRYIWDDCPLHGRFKIGNKMGGVARATCPECERIDAADFCSVDGCETAHRSGSPYCDYHHKLLKGDAR